MNKKNNLQKKTEKEFPNPKIVCNIFEEDGSRKKIEVGHRSNTLNKQSFDIIIDCLVKERQGYPDCFE